MHTTHSDPLLLQLLMHLINVGAIGEVKSEMGASSFVVGSEQGQAIATVTSFEISPVIGLPNHPHTKAGVEGHSSIHVFDANRDMTKTMDGNHGEAKGVKAEGEARG
jgi:hypothetical protein